MTKIIGLTGGIGSGKSTVAKYMASKGVPVYIADDEAKKIMNSSKVIEEVVALFGENVLNKDKKLDRKKIASIVFNNKEKLDQLNKIIHPKVKTHFKKWLQKHKNEKFVIKEVAILFETKGNLECDKVILVTAPKEVRIERVMKRDTISRDEVEARMKNQMSEETKIKLSNYIITNKNIKETYNLVSKLLKELQTSQ